MDPGTAYALSLVKKHQEEIARAIVKQSARVAPILDTIDEEARVGSAVSLIGALEVTLSRGSRKPVLDLVRQMRDLRRAAGIPSSALVASSHCYLPVLRRVLMARAADPLEGLRAYELLEADLLHLIVEGTLAVLPEEADDKEDEPDTVTDPRGKKYQLAPFTEW